MAQVWRARDLRLDRDVAVKVLFGSAARDPARRGRIAREARALASLDHANIVEVYDYGSDAGIDDDVRPYIVMELVEGPDLHQYLASEGRLKPPRFREIIVGVASAIARAHGAGVVHGDLKPANILLDEHGPKVGDFGVARILGEETGTTTAAATPTFAAPEVLRGIRPLPASDVYSLGCIAFQMLTGRPPYDGANGWEVAAKHQDAPLPSVREVAAEVPVELDRAIHSAMQKDPGLRPTVEEFASQLAPEHATVPVTPASGGQEPERTQQLPQPVDLGSVALFGSLATRTWRLRARLGRARSGRVVTAVLIVAIGVVVALVGLGIRTPAPETVAVPDLRGMTTTAASNELAGLGLDIAGVSYVAVTDGEPGLVVTTIPGVGETVEPGTDVHLIAGAEPATPEPAAPDEDEGPGRAKHGKRGRD
jgi:serine/threonine-protein kinase